MMMMIIMITTKWYRGCPHGVMIKLITAESL